MELRLEIDGQEEFAGAIDRISDQVSDFRPVWPEIEQVFYRIELEQFGSEGARGGSKWKALSPAYKKWKEVHFPGRPILVRDGRLKRSLSVIGAGGSDSIKEFRPLELILGSRGPYAIYHKRGTPKMAARPPMQFKRDDFGKIISRLSRFAERGARDAGFNVQGSKFPTSGGAGI